MIQLKEEKVSTTVVKLVMLVLCVGLLTGMEDSCEDNQKPVTPEPIARPKRFAPTLLYRGALENQVLRPGQPGFQKAQTLAEEFQEVLKLAENFRATQQKDINVIFSNQPIDGFIREVNRTAQELGHVDVLGIFSEDIDRLIQTGLIQPYPIDSIDEDLFSEEALKKMTRNGILYGLPLFFSNKRVKGIALSSRADAGLLDTTLAFNEFLAQPENRDSLAQAADGIPVPTGDGPDDGPDAPALTGVSNGSPEDEVVRDKVEAFKELRGLRDINIEFVPGQIDAFINNLQDTLKKHKHVDFLIFFAEDIQRLEEWLQPFPDQKKIINDKTFDRKAIDSMMHNGQLYGVPLFFAEDGRVKGIGVSTHVENTLLNLTLEFIDFLATPETQKLIADAANGVSARAPALIGVAHGPDDPALEKIVEEFTALQGTDEIDLGFVDGGIDDFIDELGRNLDKQGHVDFLIIFGTDVQPLVKTKWIQPYPDKIDDKAFDAKAIDAMTHNGDRYGIPLFFEDGRVEGVGVSTQVDRARLDLTLELIEFLAKPENQKRLAQVAGRKIAGR